MLLNPPLPLFLLCPPFPFCPFFSYVRSLIAASTSSWMRSTAFTMWLRCWRSSSGTCPTLFWPRSSTRPSSTPHVGFMFPLFPPLCLTLILLFFLKMRFFLLLPPVTQSILTRVAVLDPDEQQNVTQLLVYLLPACNSDTLHRLLEFLSTVTDHAHDRLDKDGQEVSASLYQQENTTQKFSSSNPWVKCLLWRI